MLVDAREAARLLGIGARKLWEITNTRELPAVRIGRAIRYDMADIRAFIERAKDKPFIVRISQNRPLG
ncbi:helix-turn-helix domain-containing protein [Telmatocola sphagniphila]|uniref:Helix-turn-helix domain-containing protein n=1 Tax=Telmatocola sphagniphila TaxID=1123043 RepID=A0A8E6ET04_9BACT|nr:helix-turn-helix domain-containing protein [Telmatocola sphagniphila]QVL31729.1 helix-turn-helix domain-containing protein [Telmatocola sphagniphila]